MYVPYVPWFFNNALRVLATQDERCPESSWLGRLVRRRKTSSASKRVQKRYYKYYYKTIWIMIWLIDLFEICISYHYASLHIAYHCMIVAKYSRYWRAAMVPHKRQQLQSCQDHILGEDLHGFAKMQLVPVLAAGIVFVRQFEGCSNHADDVQIQPTLANTFTVLTPTRHYL